MENFIKLTISDLQLGYINAYGGIHYYSSILVNKCMDHFQLCFNLTKTGYGISVPVASLMG